MASATDQQHATTTHLLVAAALILAGLIAGSMVARSVMSRPTAEPLVVKIDSGVAASPELSPAQVVRTQMTALAKSRTQPAAIADCFALASPANKVVTGPVGRFTQMLGSPAYRPLVECQDFLVGEANIQGPYALVLVSLIDESGAPHAFRFVLSLQTDPPVVDCWMTDAVLAIERLPDLSGDQDQAVEGVEPSARPSGGNPNAA